MGDFEEWAHNENRTCSHAQVVAKPGCVSFFLPIDTPQDRTTRADGHIKICTVRHGSFAPFPGGPGPKGDHTVRPSLVRSFSPWSSHLAKRGHISRDQRLSGKAQKRLPPRDRRLTSGSRTEIQRSDSFSTGRTKRFIYSNWRKE